MTRKWNGDARAASGGRQVRIRVLLGVLAAACCGALVAGSAFLSRPIAPGRLDDVSTTVLAADGRLLQLRLNSEGMWREPVSLDEVDPDLVDALIAFEDRRFYSHFGVDLVAIGRAVASLVTEGRVVSGASSLTMQVARLLQPELRRRSLGTKLRQVLYALRLEHQWSKSEILRAYFTLAPYGANLEGIKAASMAWLQKAPDDLTWSEIGLLVALPQAPERRRPDRHHEAAIAAKNHVLSSIGPTLAIDRERLAEHLGEGLRLTRYAPPALAPHLLDRNLATGSNAFGQPSTIDADWQEITARVLAERVWRLAPPINGAALVVERKTGQIRAYAGSADYLDAARKGAVNYLRARRSPGSTLKPLIYAAALDRGLITEHHVFDDRRFQRGGYAPANFDGAFSGAITLREALIRSRNVPAIETLQALGERRFENRIRSFVGSSAAPAQPAGLSLAVGGFYLTPEALAELYLGLVDPTSAPRLRFVAGARPELHAEPLVSQTAAEQIRRLMAVTLPNGRIRVAKTGTSHDRQDALAVLVTREHLIVAWFGTPDNEPTEVLTGAGVALPFAERLQTALGLDDPVIVPRAPEAEQSPALALACPRLINYPEAGEWIRTEDRRIAVSGNGHGIAWFLDGEAVTVSNDAIAVPTGGAFRLTADDGACRETAEVFVELVN